MSRILVVGIDGGTLNLLRPWASQGVLPNLARLIQDGVCGPLESTLPPVTSPAWPSFATGKNPGKHGVFDFIRPTAGEVSLVNSTSIRARTLWQILSAAGRRVGVINVPVTYPPAPVNGFLIGGLLSPRGSRFAYPTDLLEPYAAELGAYRIAPAVQCKPGHEQPFLDDLLDLVERRARYALCLLRDHPCDFFMVHFQATDVLQHALWSLLDSGHPLHDAQQAERLGPSIRAIYARIDQAIGELLAAAGDDVDLLVMSDHGFGPLHWTVNLNLLLLEAGLLQLKHDTFTRLRAGLFRAGLTPAAAWRLIERAGLQDVVWRVSKSTRNKVVGKFLSFDDVDWSRTRAYSMGHVGQIYVNLKGREPNGIVAPGAESEAVCQQVIDALQTLRHPETGQPLLERVVPGAQAAHGPYAGQGPDLHIVLDGYRAIAFPLFATDGRLVTRQIRGDTGCHRLHGLLLAAGPHIRAGQAVESARIVDLAPTILHLLGLPVPDDMDGRVLTSLLTVDRPVQIEHIAATDTPAQQDLSAEDSAEVEERLRALGYLG